MTWGEGERAGAAVVIGVGEYLHAESVRPLRFAARDAEAVAGALIDPTICGFPAGKVKLLTDAAACRDTMAHHLSKWLPSQAKGAEIVDIYFAGHGAIHAAGRREEGYLLGHDADPEDLATRGILMTDLCAGSRRSMREPSSCAWTAAMPPSSSCAGDSPGEATPRDMTIRPAMLQAMAGRGRYLIASCDEGQVSVEADRWGHGLFTHHLLGGLRAPAIATGMVEWGSPSASNMSPRRWNAMRGPWAWCRNPGSLRSDRVGSMSPSRTAMATIATAPTLACRSAPRPNGSGAHAGIGGRDPGD